jgi:hypothetical protein
MKGKSYVSYFGGLNNFCITGAKHLNSKEKQSFDLQYRLDDFKEIKKLFENESINLSLDSFNKIPLGSIIELDIGETQYGKVSEGKNIGYFEGLQGNDYVLHSTYKEGTPWYEDSAGDCSYIRAIKSIKILGEEKR